MKFILKQIRKKIFYIILILISILFYHKWFTSAIFFNGDWGYLFKTSMIDTSHFYVWEAFNHIGTLPVALFKMPVDFLMALFVHVLSPEMVIKIFYFYPIIFILPIGAFLLVKEIVEDNLSSFVGAIIISFNTYFLSINTAGHLGLIVANSFALLGLFLFFTYINNNYKNHKVLLSSFLLLTLSGFYDFRVFYIYFFIMFFYEIFNFKNNNSYLKFKNFILIGVITIFLNTFWILGILKSGRLSANEVLSRPLFGDQFWSLLYAITLYHPFWSGSKPEWFILHNIPVLFYLTPLLSFTAIFLFNKNKQLIFWSVIGLLGIFLSKQSDSPFVNVYQWLYDNFPGFNAFREATKFYILIILSYAILMSFLVGKMKLFFNKYVQILFAVGISCLFLWNGIPMVNGEIKTIFTQRNIPTDYVMFNNFLKRDTFFSRVLWIPTISTWMFYSNKHPQLAIGSIDNNRWMKILDINPVDNNNIQSINVLNSHSANLILDILNVKYVIVPIESSDEDIDFFVQYGLKQNPNIRQWYIDQLDKLDYLQKIDIGTKELVVYENKDYKPYIRGIDNLLAFNSTKNLEDKYSFVNDTLYKDFDFLVKNEKKKIPSENVIQVFEDAKSEDIKSNEVVDVESVGHKDILYRNPNKRDLVIKTADDKSEIVAIKKERLIVNGKELVDKDNTQTIFTLNDDYYNYYIKDGGTVIPFVNNARLNSEVPNEIYKMVADNVIKNGDFNNSLWQDKVGDCHHYDDGAVLSMKKVLGESSINLKTPHPPLREKGDDPLDPTSPDELRGTGAGGGHNYALQLEATKHIACTSQKNIPVESNKEYLVKFDYKPVNAKQAGFYLGFKNSGEENYQSYSERLATPDYTRGEWQHYAKIIRVPQGTTDLSFYLYAYESDGEENNIVQYDNVSVQPVELVQTINPEEKNSFVKVDLPKTNNGEYKLEYKDEQHNFANKIPNPSFENGLWAKKVGDCNHYDDNPVLGMKRITVESRKSKVESQKDKYALQFEATRHTACLSQKGIPVKGKTEYLFEFDYQGEKAKQAGYYIIFNDSNKTVINEKVPITEKDWQTFHKRFTTPADATSMTLYIYGYSKDEKTKVITRYDNFKLIELPNIANRYYLVSESEVETAKPKETTFDLINPTKKLVHIKGATKPFYLTMSESYHDKWQAELNNGKVNGFFKSWVPFVHPDVIANDKHFKYMTFLNGWYINPQDLCESKVKSLPRRMTWGQKSIKSGCTKNPDGSYDIEMVIEFTPQRYFYLGLLISGITFITLIGYLGYDFIRRRKNIL